MANVPRLFIGSSTEGKEYADAVFAELDSRVESVPWDRAFRPSSNFLEELTERLSTVDFAVFVLTPDDIVSKRELTTPAARDNVIAEVFLFIGRLGRPRVFILASDSVRAGLPTDLSGVSLLPISDRTDSDYRLMVRSACSDIKRRIDELGIIAPSDSLVDSSKARRPGRGERPSSPELDLRRTSINAAPPEEFIRSAARELLITGLTGRNSLRLLATELTALLEREVLVSYLVLHPKSEDLMRLARHEMVNLKADLKESIRVLEDQYRSRYPEHFDFGLYQHAPPFTAIMRDGGVLIRDGLKRQEGGAVRVQPRSAHTSQHRGIVFSFEQTQGDELRGFEYFQRDLGIQWDRRLHP